jgi:hypothetical protein
VCIVEFVLFCVIVFFPDVGLDAVLEYLEIIDVVQPAFRSNIRTSPALGLSEG